MKKIYQKIEQKKLERKKLYLCFTGPVRLANDDLSLCLRAADCDLLLARGVIYIDYCPAGSAVQQQKRCQIYMMRERSNITGIANLKGVWDEGASL